MITNTQRESYRNSDPPYRMAGLGIGEPKEL